MLNKKVAIEDLIPVISEAIQNGSGISMTPKGQSMLPFISDKDSVYLEKPPARLKKYDIALYYRRSSGIYVMHRLIKIKNGEYVFCGDNQVCGETGIEHADIVALVTGVSRDGKQKMRGLKYTLYCRTLFLRRFFEKVRRKLGIILKRGNR